MVEISIKDTRKRMRDAFKEDSYFKEKHIANVAMYMYDHMKPLDVHDHDERNKHAEAIIDLIFSE